jgi:phage tail sheath gpL-like
VSVIIQIPGLTNSFKVPGNYRETKYGQGKISIGAIPIKLAITGTKTTAGSATPNQDIVPIFSEDDADTYLGEGSECAMQAYAALQVAGVNLYAIPVAENGTAAAATGTITVGGTWTTGGTVTVWCAGRAVQATVSAADTTTTVAASIRDAFNAMTRFPVTATASVAVATVTARSKGTRGNDIVLRKDLSAAPPGLTITLAGGTPLTGGMVPLSGGTGADDVTTVLGLLASDVYDIQAWAQNDATNAALIKAQLASESGALIMHLEHAVFAKAGSLSNATSFASTTLNAYRASCVWLRNAEVPPSVIAAQVAAIRSVTIGDNPNFRFDNVVCPSIPGQSQKADIPLLSELNTALNNGVAPLTTNPDGTVKIVRAIQSHCLNGSSPDYRTLDWGDVDVPDRLSKELGAQWDVFATANQYVGPDPVEGEEPAPEGTGTPTLWNADIVKVLKDAEQKNWITAVNDNLPVTQWNSAAKRLMSAVIAVVKPQNHQVGISVRQVAA